VGGIAALYGIEVPNQFVFLGYAGMRGKIKHFLMWGRYRKIW
jgi:hypothetical protein